jgi:hypothetical protein
MYTDGKGSASSHCWRVCVYHICTCICTSITVCFREKLAMNINSDEAAILSAMLHGVTLS